MCLARLKAENAPSVHQVLDSKHRPLLTERALLSNLTAILSDAARTPPNQVAQSALGVLSTERRAIWAGHRDRLSQDPGNSMCLDMLDKALFVVCLDDTSPTNASEMCSNMLCGTYKLDKGVQVGTCTNRYYDKVSRRLLNNPSSRADIQMLSSSKSSSLLTGLLGSTLSTLQSTVTPFFGKLLVRRDSKVMIDPCSAADSSPTSTPSLFFALPSRSILLLQLCSKPRRRRGRKALLGKYRKAETAKRRRNPRRLTR